MALFAAEQVPADLVRSLAAEHWGLQVAKLLKESQNTTWLAEDAAGVRFVLRATPDPAGARAAAANTETALLAFLEARGLSVCAAVPSRVTGSCVVSVPRALLVCFRFAVGDPVVFTDFVWLLDRAHVEGVGRWLGALHRLTRDFALLHPELAAALPAWDELHSGVLAGVPIAAEDRAAAQDPARFGVLHGDVNPSNYHFSHATGTPCVFDWDQAQRGWFLYDLAQPVWAAVAVERGGNILDNGKPVPGADAAQYTEWLVAGYEAEGGAGAGARVDRAALARMVSLRRALYDRFCRRALSQLQPGTPMYQFCAATVAWLDKYPVGRADF